MDSLDLQVLRQARDWRDAQGRAVWLVTVIETWGSAPRPPGALLAMRDDGLVVGSVSGGCVEDDLIDRVRKGERVATPSLITYGVTKEEAARFGLPCGGNLRLVQEPLVDTAWIDEVLRAHRAATSWSPASSTSTSGARARSSRRAAARPSASTAARCARCSGRAGACSSSAPASSRARSRRWRSASTSRSSSATRARSTT